MHISHYVYVIEIRIKAALTSYCGVKNRLNRTAYYPVKLSRYAIINQPDQLDSGYTEFINLCKFVLFSNNGRLLNFQEKVNDKNCGC